MQLFHRIEDAQAIVRSKSGVYKQAELYHRAGKVFVKVNGGFIRIVAFFGDVWGTSAPGISVIDMPSDISQLAIKPEPRWKGEA